MKYKWRNNVQHSTYYKRENGSRWIWEKKLKCPLGDRVKPYVTGTQERCDSSDQDMNKILSKNMWQSTQHNWEIGQQ